MISNKPKVLILDVHGPYEPWLSILHNGQLKTWADRDKFENLEIVHAMGLPVDPLTHKLGEFLYSLKFSKPHWVGLLALCIDFAVKKLIGRFIPNIKEIRDEEYGYKKWEVQMPDYALLMGNKMISVLKYALENSDFDYLATTITSTFINRSKLIEYVDLLPRTNLLAGNFVTRGSEHFQQGAFRLYSRDVVEFIVKNRAGYNHWALEDVAMGRLLRNKGFDEYSIPNITVGSLDCLRELNPIEIGNQVYLRCKGVTKYGNKLRGDVSILLAVNEISSS